MKNFLSLFGGWQGYAAVAFIAASLAAFSSWYVTDAAMGRTLATERQERAEEKLTQAEAARAETDLHRALEAALWGKLGAIQAQSEKDAENDRKANERLGADLVAGTRRLRLAVICPAAAAGDAVTDRASAELCTGTAEQRAEALRRAFLDIRADIALDGRTIRSCQADARSLREAVAGLRPPR